ncbi:uncharacterized protein LOC113559000 [Rhopalosiphum maidis]|uniref:uncharacterized protein LOC113559000 n=1 Tax=Rhopalosiphum maidis TaxID=43146 RepID=UPI000EFF1ADB|nr:uncharacterized protein LOC113559000 [Rhopalosiphum maidis]
MFSKHTEEMFQVVLTLLLLLRSAVSHPIRLNSEECQYPSENNVEGMYNAPPPCGEGRFRDPLEILGVKFPESRIKHLCKADVYMYADKISNVSFPPDAIKLCGCVCEGYQDTMVFDVGVKVKVINANCDYTGATIIKQHSANETHAAVCPDLSTACVCTYNVRCNQRTRPITYTLTPNQQGYLRVEVADCGNSNIT